jgi:hypothetical protein
MPTIFCTIGYMIFGFMLLLMIGANSIQIQNEGTLLIKMGLAGAGFIVLGYLGMAAEALKELARKK